MRQRLSHVKRAFLVLAVIGIIEIFLNLMGTSVLRFSISFRKAGVAQLRLSNEAIIEFGKHELNNGQTIDTVLNGSGSEMNNKYYYGLSEKKLPLVKIYEFLPQKESDTKKTKRFELINDWLELFKADVKAKQKSKCTDVVKRILWFDVWHDGTGVRNKCRKVDFSKCDCHCEVDFFINDDTQKTYDPFGGDAILMQINKLAAIKFPPLKRSGQVFVAVEREATPKLRIPVQNFEYVFNWTMTFRQDSDIYYPYGRIVNKTDIPLEKNFTDIYRRKKKGIVWFVSHCKTRTRREEYAKELSNYIDLDIVGKCGRDICPKHSPHCLPKFEEEYFFRFNFENTYHRDYVTEKLFDNFSKDMIQIVGGAADYSTIVPANTVIDVKDFDSPKALATYLKILMNNEELYTGFLKRKSQYYAETLHEQSQRSYCELCSMLHDPDRYRNL